MIETIRKIEAINKRKDESLAFLNEIYQEMYITEAPSNFILQLNDWYEKQERRIKLKWMNDLHKVLSNH